MSSVPERSSVETKDEHVACVCVCVCACKCVFVCVCECVCVRDGSVEEMRRCFPPSLPLLFVYLFRFSSRRPRRNFSSITRKILSLPPPPLGDYNGPTGRSVTSQHGRCSLFTLLVPHFHTNLLSDVRQCCDVKRGCYMSDLRLLFLSFSKMFIGGLSWQTTQGELSRTLLHSVEMKASCSLHFSRSVCILRISRITSPKLAVNSSRGACYSARIRSLDFDLPGRARARGGGRLTREMRAHSPLCLPFSLLSFRLLLTHQGRAQEQSIDRSIAGAELVLAIAPTLLCCFPDLPFIRRDPSESLFFLCVRVCSHPGRRRVTTAAAAVRSFVWPNGPLC